MELLFRILAIVILIAVIAITLYVLETYFPRLWVLAQAALIAAIVLGAIRFLRAWLCSWLCGA